MKASWKHRAHLTVSILLCALAVLLGTLLYPLVLLFFTALALLVPMGRRILSSRSSGPNPPERSGA